jgi:RNA polymerase Rpb2, domain 3
MLRRCRICVDATRLWRVPESKPSLDNCIQPTLAWFVLQVIDSCCAFCVLGRRRVLHFSTNRARTLYEETPEGQAVGLVKNLALMAYITTGTAQVPVLEFLEEFSTENLKDILP